MLFTSSLAGADKIHSSAGAPVIKTKLYTQPTRRHSFSAEKFISADRMNISYFYHCPNGEKEHGGVDNETWFYPLEARLHSQNAHAIVRAALGCIWKRVNTYTSMLLNSSLSSSKLFGLHGWVNKSLALVCVYSESGGGGGVPHFILFCALKGEEMKFSCVKILQRMLP